MHERRLSRPPTHNVRVDEPWDAHPDDDVLSHLSGPLNPIQDDRHPVHKAPGRLADQPQEALADSLEEPLHAPFLGPLDGAGEDSRQAKDDSLQTVLETWCPH